MTDVHADTETPSRRRRWSCPTSRATLARLEKRDEELAARAARVAARGSKPTRIVSARVSVWLRLVEMWRARELFVFLVRKEIKVKYKNSVLGFLWSMLNPALPWPSSTSCSPTSSPTASPTSSSTCSRPCSSGTSSRRRCWAGTVSVVVNAGIVKKVAFPREILVLASVGSAFVFFFYQSLVMVGFMIAFHHAPAWGEIWLLIPALAAIIVFAAALAIFLSAVNVYLRDTQHLVEVLLVAWFWAIPVVYAFSAGSSSRCNATPSCSSPTPSSSGSTSPTPSPPWS